VNREAIYAGLFAQLAGLGLFVTKSRTLRHWADVTSGEQPALFQAQGKETALTATGQPTRWELRLNVYLYVRTDPSVDDNPLNPLLDAITNKINERHPITGTNRLGSTIPGVEWVRVDGTIETDEGTLGQQGVAIIPLLILATD
jgi:hypothetical protein